jgi:LuxR family maltose regulon positive regulatory protein
MEPVSLLMTKLYIPPLRPGVVPRPRLVERLDESLRLGRALTLISAPAGFGKTTLLVEWIQGRSDGMPPLRAAWVSLDEGDNNPTQFMSYLITALKTLDLPIREGLLEALQSPQPPLLESVLASLISDLASLVTSQTADAPVVLVLDDYHILKARAIHDAVTFLIDHLLALPHAPHIVIASRSDPPLSLARLRGQGLLTELRVDDLRFTEDEAAALLQDMTSLSVTPEEIAALEGRTEGWITGLQLAAIALQAAASAPASDISRFIQEFTGSHRFVLDYLVEEVFAHQPPHIKRFLLQTSILDRLSAPLCGAVCFPTADTQDGLQDAQTILEALERANLFIVPLDETRRWYRYHRLFADLLHSQLKRLGTELGCAPAGELHQRASHWYEAQGLLAGAVGHALAAEDFERAADLVEGHGLQMLKRGEMTALLTWLADLPAAVIRSRPQLCIYQAWALSLSGRLVEVEPSLQAAESGAEGDLSNDRLGQIAAIRSYVAGQRGEIDRAVDLAHQALVLLDEENLVVRSVVAFTLGGVHLADGDLTTATRSLTQASEMGQVAGNIHLAVPASTLLADLTVQQGRLHTAFDAYQRTLEVAGHSPVAAQAHSGMGMVLYEWNDLESAAHHLAQSIELGQLWGNVGALSSDYIALAQVRYAQGDLSGTYDAMEEAERLAEGKGVHPSAVARVAAGRLRLAVGQGDLPAVERWVRASKVEVEGEVNLFNEAEYVTLARALLALGQAGAAGTLLGRLLAAAEKGGRLGRSIELLILHSLAYHAQGDQDRSLGALAKAVALSEPEGYQRTFLDEGEPLRSLLSEFRSRLKNQAGAVGDPDPERLLTYSAELLAAFAATEPGTLRPHSVAQTNGSGAGLVEALSEREMEVLRLVATGLSNQAIADQLFIAVSTVKSHTNSIYGKLGVRNRTQAVAQARTLGLL